MQCTECEAPKRRLWVLFGEHRRPTLTDVQTGNWAVLQRCPACGALWYLFPYEPYASFPFLALWPHDEARWRDTFAVDDGRTLLAWHASMVGQHYQNLPELERELVEQFRRRSYGHNPIDSPDTFRAAALPPSSEEKLRRRNRTVVVTLAICIILPILVIALQAAHPPEWLLKSFIGVMVVVWLVSFGWILPENSRGFFRGKK